MDGRPRRVSCEEDVCWVCLEGASDLYGSLEHPCACPRGVHAKCLARWQLQSAGREEERYCRFCKSELPDWRDILTPKVPAAPPVMAIVYDGKVVRLQVKPGREGMLEFQRQVRRAFNLGDDVELDCVFDCRAPGTGEKIKLRGLESYSAAMHCAAVAAGERIAKQKAELGTGGTAGSSAASGSRSVTGGSSSNNSSFGGSGSSTSRGTTAASSSTAPASPSRTPPDTTTTARGNAITTTAVAATLAAPSTPPRRPQDVSTPASPASAAAAIMTSPATPCQPSVRSYGLDTAASAPPSACHLPVSARTPRFGGGNSGLFPEAFCGGGAAAGVGSESATGTMSAMTTPRSLHGGDHLQDQTPGGTGRTGRRRNFFMSIVRGLNAVRRVL